MNPLEPRRESSLGFPDQELWVELVRTKARVARLSLDVARCQAQWETAREVLRHAEDDLVRAHNRLAALIQREADVLGPLEAHSRMTD